MKVDVLQAVGKIVSKISNQSSLSTLYKSVEIGPDTIRCCSEFGNIELTIESTGLTQCCLVDTTAALAVANSLPGSSEITLEEKNNKINWKCGSAKGHLNLVTTDDKIPVIDHKDFPWTPSKALPDALNIAACACQSQAVSIDLYGITVEPVGNVLHLLSSNSIALAMCKIDKGTYPTGMITLRPPVPGVIAAILKACKDAVMDVTEEGIFIFGGWLLAKLPLGTKLGHDLLKLANEFDKTTTVAKIDSDAVKKFITRARALSDRNTSFTVGLKIEQGKLALEYNGIASSTEEFFLAEGLPAALSYATVALPADMLLLPLQFVETAVFDYLDKQQLVLKGTNPEFTYVVGGAD